MSLKKRKMIKYDKDKLEAAHRAVIQSQIPYENSLLAAYAALDAYEVKDIEEAFDEAWGYYQEFSLECVRLVEILEKVAKYHKDNREDMETQNLDDLERFEKRWLALMEEIQVAIKPYAKKEKLNENQTNDERN